MNARHLASPTTILTRKALAALVAGLLLHALTCALWPLAAHCQEAEADSKALEARQRSKRILEIAAELQTPEAIGRALRPFFTHWQQIHLAVLEQIQEAGYEIKTVDAYAPGDEQRKTAFIHYDIHLRDLPAAFGVLDLNRARGIPADYCVHWRYGPREKQREEQFLLLRKFDSPLTPWALHTDPFSTFLTREICPDPTQYKRWLASPSFKETLASLLASEASHAQLVTALEALLLELHSSFREHFPRGRFVNAHGSPLNRILLSFEPPLREKTEALHSANFLSRERVARLGLGRSDYGFRTGKDMAYVSDSACMASSRPVFAERLQAALEKGKSLFILIHPYVLDTAPDCYLLPQEPS